MRHNFLLLNYPVELLPRKGFNEQTLIRIEVCAFGADFHSGLEAVAGLTGYMAGLRHFCVDAPLAQFPPPMTTNDELFII